MTDNSQNVNGCKRGNWIRLSRTILLNQKVGELTPEQGWFWVRCLLSCDATTGALPPAKQLAYQLRMDAGDVHRIVGMLVEAGLIDHHASGDGKAGYRIHDWTDWQTFVKEPPKSSTARVAKHRAKKAAASKPAQAKQQGTPAATANPTPDGTLTDSAPMQPSDDGCNVKRSSVLSSVPITKRVFIHDSKEEVVRETRGDTHLYVTADDETADGLTTDGPASKVVSLKKRGAA